jgi:DNA topoisomerase-3
MHVAEKPSVAKEVTRVLSNGQFETTNSLSRFNPVFRFTHQGNVWLFTSVAGHLMEDEFPPETKSWTRFPFVELFSAPVTKSVKETNKPMQRNLEDLARKAQRLVLWLDCDREGENIAFEVKNVVEGIRGPAFPCSRARFSALTARDLQHAVAHLAAPDKNMSDAVDARQEMDLRIGAAFTRFQTVTFGDHFDSLPRVLSFGPCQFPCLGFVVQRHWEREAFISEAFFNAVMTDASGGSTVKFNWRRGNIYDAQIAAIVAEEMFEAAEADGHKASVVAVDKRPSRKAAPHPLATVQLQKLASQYLHMSSDQCMQHAEALYMEGIISYPRTETDMFTYTEVELKNMVQVQQASPLWGPYAARVLNEPLYRTPTSGGHNDKAHPPIHPLKCVDPPEGPKGKVYELVVRNFLACVSKDAEAADTQVRVAYGGEEFQAGGHTIVARNWLDVFTYQSWNNTTVPNYQVGDTFTPGDVQLHEGQTQPPPHLNEVNLITMMDEFGIGTDATIAQHIKTIQDREYVTVTGGVFYPSQLGIALLAAYERIGMTQLWQPQLRAQMERAMGDIASGAATKQAVVASAVDMYKAIFLAVLARQALMMETLTTHLTRRQRTAAATTVNANFVVCGQCRGWMSLCTEPGQGPAPNVFAHCTACNLSLRLPGKGQLSRHGAICPICSFGVVTVTNSETGREHTVCAHCFTKVPPGALADVEAASGEMRCFQCTRADCALSGGSDAIQVKPCPNCRGSLRLKRSTKNTGGTSFFIGCKAYPQCTFNAYLPTCESATVSSNTCTLCAARLIAFNFGNPIQAPPNVDVVDELCVFCDSRLRGFVTFRGANANAPAAGGVGGFAAAGQDALVHRGFAPAAAAYVMPEVEQPTRKGRGRGARGGAATGTARGGGSRGRARGGGGDGDAAAAVGGRQCECGQPAAQRTSRTAANTGRRFFTCETKTCKFFEWAD